MSIDERLRTAAAVLRERVDAHVADSIPELPHERRARRGRALLSVLVVVCVLGITAVVAAVRLDGEHPQPRVASGAPDLYFRLAEVPKGMSLQLVSGGLSSVSGGVGFWTLDQHYVRYNSARDRALGILTLRSGPGPVGQSLTEIAGSLADGLGYTPTTIDVRGRPATLVGDVVAWEETAQLVVVLRAPIGPEQLRAVANGLQARPDRAGFDPGVLPEGYEPLAEHPNGFTRTAHSYAWYGAAAGTRSLRVAAYKSSSVPAIAELTQRGARRFDVHGDDAVVWQQPLLGRTIAWDEAPGVRVEIASKGFRTKTLVRIARSLVAMSEKQWARYGTPHGILRTPGLTPPP